MKKLAIITFLIIGICSFSMSQAQTEHPQCPAGHTNCPPPPPGEPGEHHGNPNSPMMLKMKKDFIKENFIIEGNKKEAFWAAYEKFEKSILDAHKEQKEFRKSNGLPKKMDADSLSSLSDEAIILYYENNLQTKNRVFQAEETFFNDLKRCLSAQQIAQYYLLEKNFQKSAVRHHGVQPMMMDPKPAKKEMCPGGKNNAAPKN